MVEIVCGILVLLLMVGLSGIKAVREYHRLVIYRLGQVDRCVGPGLQFMIPFLERAEIVDTRAVTLPTQMIEETTHDHHQVRVSALCIYQVSDPKRAITKVQNVHKATAEVTEMAVRRVITQHDLRSIIAERSRLNWSLKTILEKDAREWGVRINSIEIREVKVSRDSRRSLIQAKTHEAAEFLRVPDPFKYQPLGDN